MFSRCFAMAPPIEVGIIFNTRVGWGKCLLEGVDAALERMGVVFDTRVSVVVSPLRLWVSSYVYGYEF